MGWGLGPTSLCPYTDTAAVSRWHSADTCSDSKSNSPSAAKKSVRKLSPRVPYPRTSRNMACMVTVKPASRMKKMPRKYMRSLNIFGGGSTVSGWFCELSAAAVLTVSASGTFRTISTRGPKTEESRTMCSRRKHIMKPLSASTWWERCDQYLDGRAGGRTGGRTDGRAGGRTVGRTVRRTDGRSGGQIDRPMGGRA